MRFRSFETNHLCVKAIGTPPDESSLVKSQTRERVEARGVVLQPELISAAMKWGGVVARQDGSLRVHAEVRNADVSGLLAMLAPVGGT
jgi:hypothetical protein